MEGSSSRKIPTMKEEEIAQGGLGTGGHTARKEQSQRLGGVGKPLRGGTAKKVLFLQQLSHRRKGWF